MLTGFPGPLVGPKKLCELSLRFPISSQCLCSNTLEFSFLYDPLTKCLNSFHFFLLKHPSVVISKHSSAGHFLLYLHVQGLIAKFLFSPGLLNIYDNHVQ